MVTDSAYRAALYGVEKVIASQSSLLRKHVQDEADRRVFQWLKAPDVWRNLRNALAKRQPGTGDWFISSASFQTWLSTPQFLWLTGIPGAGKTILSSTIIATLLCQQEGSLNAVVFSYFDFQDASYQLPDTLLRVLLAQLATQSSAALRSLRELHDEVCASGSREPSSDDLLRAVTAALASFPKTFVVVDALDECSDLRMLLNCLKAISGLPNIHIVALSRREREIELALQGITHEIPLTGASIDKDIALYIKHRMGGSEDMMLWSPEDRKKVQDNLTSKAGGMYVFQTVGGGFWDQS
jgi:hypothetical protein